MCPHSSVYTFHTGLLTFLTTCVENSYSDASRDSIQSQLMYNVQLLCSQPIQLTAHCQKFDLLSMESMSADVFTLQLCYCMYTAPLFADNLQNKCPKIVICCLQQIVETLLIGCEHSHDLCTTDAPMPMHSLLLSQLKCFTSERNPYIDWTGLSHLTTLPFSLSSPSCPSPSAPSLASSPFPSPLLLSFLSLSLPSYPLLPSPLFSSSLRCMCTRRLAQLVSRLRSPVPRCHLLTWPARNEPR